MSHEAKSSLPDIRRASIVDNETGKPMRRGVYFYREEPRANYIVIWSPGRHREAFKVIRKWYETGEINFWEFCRLLYEAWLESRRGV